MTRKSVLAGIAAAAVSVVALAIGQGPAHVALGTPAVGGSVVRDPGALIPDQIELTAVSGSKTRHFALRIGGAEAAGFFKEATGFDSESVVHEEPR